jgi:hypothetical protein
MKTTLLALRNSMKRSRLRRIFLLIQLPVICFSLSPEVQAVLPPPPPGGGYPGGNTAAGNSALRFLTSGGDNTALGFFALARNTGGNFNTATGPLALLNNFNAVQNTATGSKALEDNTRGTDNTANGLRALRPNKGSGNTAMGSRALGVNTTGDNNIAVGNKAGRNLTTGNNNIDIGSDGVAGESSVLRIGDAHKTRTFIAGISGTGVTGAAVYVNAGGQLGTAPSSERFKDEIKPMDKVSEAIFALKPVTFRYKKELDPEGSLQFGLVAEDVEKVNPALVVRDKEGKPYSVRYDAVNAMLLNEFLKQHHRVEDLESGVAQLTARFEEQDAKIQKVSAQIEMGKPAPQMANNP